MKADTITKAYVQDASIFADIFNYYVYQGRQVIEPEQLKERDSTKIALPYGADGAVVPVRHCGIEFLHIPEFLDWENRICALWGGEPAAGAFCNACEEWFI